MFAAPDGSAVVRHVRCGVCFRPVALTVRPTRADAPAKTRRWTCPSLNCRAVNLLEDANEILRVRPKGFGSLRDAG
jgi:hypothetical protein